MRLATSWHGAGGFPSAVRKVFSDCNPDEFGGIDFLVGLPEHQVPLPGGRRPSQTDLLVFARTATGRLAVIAVEGKTTEPFGPLVSEWLADASDGKLERLDYLCNLLGLARDDAEPLRYQLLHRTASAVIEANRFTAPVAMMLVHSFGDPGESRGDFDRFARALGVATDCELSRATGMSSAELYLAWVGE